VYTLVQTPTAKTILYRTPCGRETKVGEVLQDAHGKAVRLSVPVLTENALRNLVALLESIE